MKWITKFTPAEKFTIQKNAHAKRKATKPSRHELGTVKNARVFCKQRKLSSTATQRIIQLVENDYCHFPDERDHRTLAPRDRVPRSLEEQDTPPGYWDISI